jgi:hypothetical protein
VFLGFSKTTGARKIRLCSETSAGAGWANSTRSGATSIPVAFRQKEKKTVKENSACWRGVPPGVRLNSIRASSGPSRSSSSATSCSTRLYLTRRRKASPTVALEARV